MGLKSLCTSSEARICSKQVFEVVWHFLEGLKFLNIFFSEDQKLLNKKHEVERQCQHFPARDHKKVGAGSCFTISKRTWISSLSNLGSFWHFPIWATSDTFQSEQFQTISNLSSFWHFQILALSNSDTFQTLWILALSNFQPFWHFPIPKLSDSDTFQFWHFSDSDTFRFRTLWNSDTFQFGKKWILTLSSLSNNEKMKAWYKRMMEARADNLYWYSSMSYLHWLEQGTNKSTSDILDLGAKMPWVNLDFIYEIILKIGWAKPDSIVQVRSEQWYAVCNNSDILGLLSISL